MSVGISGLGPWPGTEPLPAAQQVLDVLAAPPSGVDGVPHLVTLPGRGPGGEAVGRTLALAESMPATLEPHGWRLGLAGDRAQQRARSWLAQDVEALGIAAAGYAGTLALPVLGPWTLAASVWLPRGERVVSDALAVRDVVDAVAAGVGEHIAAVRRVLSWTTTGAGSNGTPGTEVADEEPTQRLTVLVAEPRMDAVLRGTVPSFSGVSRLASVEPGVVSGVVRTLVSAWDEAGADVVVLVPPDAAAIRAVLSGGAAGVALDVPRADAAAWDALGEGVEAGARLWAGVVPARGDGSQPRPDALARVLLAPWRRLGLADAAIGSSVVLTPRAGLAAVAPRAARGTLDDVARAAAALGELLI